MIVHADDRCCPVRDGIGKDLPRVDEAVVQQADCDDPVPQHLPGAVEGDAAEVFLPLVPEVGDKGKDVIGFCYLASRSSGAK